MKLSIDNWISILSFIVSTMVAYFTARWAVVHSLKYEKYKGKVILLQLINRYFASCLNSWDKDSGKLKKDVVTRNQYIRVVEQVETDLLELQNNLYYSDLLCKYPLITLVQIQLSRDLAELSISKSLILNTATADKFYELYNLLKNDLPKKYKKDQSFLGIEQSITGYIKALKGT